MDDQMKLPEEWRKEIQREKDHVAALNRRIDAINDAHRVRVNNVEERMNLIWANTKDLSFRQKLMWFGLGALFQLPSKAAIGYVLGLL